METGMDERVLLAHGSGGKLSRELIARKVLPQIANPILAVLDDAAVFDISGRAAFTTDSYVVSPLFFPGGDIGKLAVCGTVNDLSMVGARPLYISLALIIEEGFPVADLEKVMNSVARTAQEAGVQVVTGDTKVVNRGMADKLFINTSGLGLVPIGVNISGANGRPGDKVILSGPLGQHGIAVMAQREGLRFQVPVASDCAPLNKLVSAMMEAPGALRSLRDPTRGGLATSLVELAQQSRTGITIYQDRIPADPAVMAASEILGLDPLYLANEGKLVAIVNPEAAEAVLARMKENPLGRESAIIGEVTAADQGRVIMKTSFGASRIIEMLSGELLPRIC
jgi:hydrogenase expression/formation protein HypE